jgi:hypothetical protein
LEKEGAAEEGGFLEGEVFLWEAGLDFEGGGAVAGGGVGGGAEEFAAGEENGVGGVEAGEGVEFDEGAGGWPVARRFRVQVRRKGRLSGLRRARISRPRGSTGWPRRRSQ